MTRSENDKIHILMIDDDEEDLQLMLEIMRDYSIDVDTSIAYDGQEALEYLIDARNENKSDLPDLIMLDLNMPRKSGYELLAELKTDPCFRQIPVIVLTSSGNQDDIDTCYHAGANCYLKKPTGIDELQEMIRTLNNFWFKQVKYATK